LIHDFWSRSLSELLDVDGRGVYQMPNCGQVPMINVLLSRPNAGYDSTL
jgi:hypothetical protein